MPEALVVLLSKYVYVCVLFFTFPADFLRTYLWLSDLNESWPPKRKLAIWLCPAHSLVSYRSGVRADQLPFYPFNDISGDQSDTHLLIAPSMVSLHSGSSSILSTWSRQRRGWAIISPLIFDSATRCSISAFVLVLQQPSSLCVGPKALRNTFLSWYFFKYRPDLYLR